MGDRLKDAVGIVTGASSGFGREIAKAFAAEEMAVVCSDVRELPRDGGYEDHPDMPTAELIEERGDEAAYVECDVTDPSAVDALVDACVEEYGRLDVMMNNAGIYPPIGRLHERPVEDLERAHAVNVRGVFNGSKSAVEQFLEQDSGGHVLNLVSAAGLQGWANQLAYNASKGAAKQITETIAIEYGPDGIRANAICPGFAPTALTSDLYEVENFQDHVVECTPYGDRWVSAEDVANVAVFLASEESEFVTGETHRIDGGHSLTYAHTKDL